MSEEERVQKILMLLSEKYPEKKSSLNYKNPLQMLVSTILSAQCTDARVNIVTKTLFKKYKNVKDYANANINEFQKDIKPTGFYKNKTKNIINTCKLIIKDYNSKVPDNMADLLKLHGVARKTANIVLGSAYGKIVGIAVDTHVKRISYRLGFTANKNPNKIEKDLMKITPKKDWWYINHVLVDHGRAICKAPTPLCSKCFLNELCPKNGVVKSK